MMWLGIASAVMSVIGSLQASKQQSAQYQAQAQANAYNAAVQRQRADSVRSSYGQQEERVRRYGRMQLGKLRASLAQTGGFEGSNADIERQSEVMAEMDALNVRYEGELEAHGLLAGAGLEDYYAGVNTSNASNARRAGYLGAAGAALSGAGNYLRLGGSFGSGGDRPTFTG